MEPLIKQFAGSATQDPRAARRVAHRLSRLIDECFAHPSRRDGRGRKSGLLRKVEGALRQLIHATAWQHREDLDLNVRQEAKALVRTACHGQVPFEVLMERASALRGRVNKAGRTRNARQPVKGCDPLREELPQGFSVERLHTVEGLAEAGRRLGNCAKNNGHGLHDRLRRRESDFYLMRRGGDPVAMFEVDLETGKIDEFLGKGNDDVALPHCVLIALLRRLELNGDDADACLQQGAASIFASGARDVRHPDWERGKLKVWRGARRLVVWEHRKRRRRNRRRSSFEWSSFEWDGDDWVASDASSRYGLDGLMTRHPSIAELAHSAMKLGRGR